MAELVVCMTCLPASMLFCSGSGLKPRGLIPPLHLVPRLPHGIWRSREGCQSRADRGRVAIECGLLSAMKENAERWGRTREQTRRSEVRASNQDGGVDVDDAPQRKVFVDPKVWLTLIDAELGRGNDREALSLAQNLSAFGKAAMVPQKLYTLEDLRLNKIDASKFLSPVDRTLESVRRNSQVALIAGAVAAWRTFDLDVMQVLGVVVLFLFIGTVDQVVNAGGLESLILDTLGRQFSRNYKERVAQVLCNQHEAGHFLISYLMGILPKGYTLSSLDAFKRYAALNVQAGTTFVDFQFQEEVASGKVSAATLDKVSCIALAGVATEYLLYGVAEGGLADIQQLDDLMRGVGFTQRKADGQVRWAVLNTVTLLRRHKAVHSKLATAMSFGQTVAECIGLIESELMDVAYI